MRGHNRPRFPPKVPGTEMRSWDVPTAIIYRPARSAMTSAPRPNYWVLEFEPLRPLWIEPLMGYTSSDDPYRSIRLKFPDQQSAIDFAEHKAPSILLNITTGGISFAKTRRPVPTTIVGGASKDISFTRALTHRRRFASTLGRSR